MQGCASSVGPALEKAGMQCTPVQQPSAGRAQGWVQSSSWLLCVFAGCVVCTLSSSVGCCLITQQKGIRRGRSGACLSAFLPSICRSLPNEILALILQLTFFLHISLIRLRLCSCFVQLVEWNQSQLQCLVRVLSIVLRVRYFENSMRRRNG